MYKNQIQKMEEKLEESRQEIVKGNSIIQKQQADFKQLKQKNKVKSMQQSELEKTIQDRQDSISSHQGKINELKEAQI